MRHVGPVRFVLDAGGDIEVRRGTSLAQARPALARLTGDPRLDTCELWVADRRLAPDHPAGTVPWIEGSVLTVGGPGPVDPAARAALAPWHLAVTTGPDAGRVVCPDGDRAVLTSTGLPEVVVRRRPSWGRRERWRVTVGRGERRRLAVGRRSRTVRAGQLVRLGPSTIIVRRLADLTTEHDERDERRERPAPPPMTTWLVPLLVSIGLVVATRNPVYLLFSLGGPLGMLVPRRVPHRHGEPGFARDPAATAVLSRPPAWWSAALDGLAVVGPRRSALGTARALVGESLPIRLTLLHARADAADWAWCRWLTADPVTDLPAPEDGPRLVVVDDARHWSALPRWWGTRPEGTAALVVVPPDEMPPAWCRWVLRVGPGPHATLEVAGDVRVVEAPWAPYGWAERLARATVGAADDGAVARPDTSAAPPGSGSAHHLPARVGLADLVTAPEWSGDEGGALRSLATPIGVGTDGRPVEVDLLTGGPHALVAGTTGAGKSELLQSLLLGLALRHPPTALAMVLVDYKGGASFGACRDLPHVIGQVTDLDQVGASRALQGLRAELRRRELLLAAAGVGDLETLRQDHSAPPRILVVVDEFRALTEELPDFVPGLVRLAAQGRSLGIHLVLATQRPAGAVSAEMRANIALRMCLRVTEPADSVDVIEVPDAAHLPAGRPGRAIVRRGAAAPEPVQTAWAALAPAAVDAEVAWASPWPFDAAGGEPGEEPADTGRDHSIVLVDLARAEAERRGYGPPDPVWLSPLPERVRPDDLPVATHRPAAGDPGERPSGALPFALADLPSQQRRAVACWATATGPLIVAGRAGSGRTTALLALAGAALRNGWQVHAVNGTGAFDGLIAHPGVGTVVGPDDPRRLARLLGALAGTGEGQVLLVDDWGSVATALDRMPRGVASDLLQPLLRDGRHRGMAVAVAGTAGEVSRLLPTATERLVLAVADAHEDALLGVPRELVGGRDVPGRAVHLSPRGARRCQIVDGVGDCTDAAVGFGVNGAAGRAAARLSGTAGVSPPLRLLPLPTHVTRTDLPAAPGEGPVIGVGGDTAGPVHLDVGLGVLVVGPSGSGRSTALATIAAGLVADGRPVLTVGRDGPVGAGELVEHLRRPPAEPRAAVLIIDDVDVLTRTTPELDDLLAELVTAAEGGDPSVPRVVVSARTDRAAAAYRGVVAALRGSAPVLVLSPAAPGSSDVAGDLALTVDPMRPEHPGRGALVHRGRATSVQVASDRSVRPVRSSRARPDG